MVEGVEQKWANPLGTSNLALREPLVSNNAQAHWRLVAAHSGP